MKGKYPADAYLKFLIYLVVIVLINLVGLTAFFRVDLTQNRIYSLSKASREAVSTLSEPLTINVFFTENLPAPHNNTKRYLRDLLEEYAIYANRYFNYRFYDVSPREEGSNESTEENQRLAEGYGIYPVEIRMLERDEIKFKKAYMGLVVIHGDLIEEIPAITSTDGLEYRLTSKIEKLNRKISTLVSLSEKVRIRLVMSASLAQVAPLMGLDTLPQLPDRIKELVSELNQNNYGKLTYEYTDPVTTEDLDALQDKYHLMVLKWPDIPENRISAGEGAIGLVMEYKNRASQLPLIQVLRIPLFGTRYEMVDTETLKERVNQNIETLIGINADLGYLADHGTLSLSGPMPDPSRQGGQVQNLQFLLSENYNIRQIALGQDDLIPESVNCLIIAHPTEAFTDYELYQIDQALMRGTNLAVFTDAFKEIPQPRQQQFAFNMGPSYEPLHTGLEKLLAHYGVKVKPSYVMDKNCYKQPVSSRSGGGERPLYFAPIIKDAFINHDLAFTNNIKGLITMNSSPVVLDHETIKKHDLAAHEILSTSDESWEMTGRINLNPMFIQPPESADKFKSLPIACLIEGNFPSYFDGKEIPVKEQENPEADAEDSQKPNPEASKIESRSSFVPVGKPCRICLVGSSALLTDSLIDPDGASPNAVFVLNLIDTLNNRDQTAAMRSKTQQFNPLEETGGVTRSFIKLFNIGGLPALVVVYGLLVWWRRRLRRKRIQAMFQ